jgi:RNA polymerase sigma-B factor
MTPRPAISRSNLSAAASRRLRQRNQRVDAYRQIVRPIALHYAGLCRESSDDLIQVGLLGLIRAAELYRSSEGTPFTAFARHHIRGAILHYLRDQAPVIRLPRRQQELEDRLRVLSRVWQARSPQLSADREVQAALGLTDLQWQRFQQLRLLSRTVSLEPATEECVAAEDSVEASPDAGLAIELLGRLEERQQTAVREVVLAGQSLRRAAKRMGVSPMTVHRLLHRALDELRSQLDGADARLNQGWSQRRCEPSAAPAC